MEPVLKHERAVAGSGHAGGGDGQNTIGRGARHRAIQIRKAGEAGEACGDRAQEP
jgi:hypothetical protein